MKAICVHSFGGPEMLRYEDAPTPEPAADELGVRVHAAGVNALDWLVREGGFEEFGHIAVPWIPGWDLSGVVEEVGSGVTQYQVGDAVFGMVRMPEPGNAYAEYAAVPAEDVVAKPTKLDHPQSAAVPMAALTAWQAMIDEGRLQPGQRVLIHAASGGWGIWRRSWRRHTGRGWSQPHPGQTRSSCAVLGRQSSSTTAPRHLRNVWSRLTWSSMASVALCRSGRCWRSRTAACLSRRLAMFPARCDARRLTGELRCDTLVCGRMERRCLRYET
jgi:Alcohol dehydrogenase GroES-like domain